SRCRKAYNLTLLKTLLLHAPEGKVYAVLPEKRFAFKYQRGHTPMAGGFQCLLVLRNFLVQFFCLRLCFTLKLGKIQSRALRSSRQVIARVPVFHTAPDQAGNFSGEGQSFAPARGRLPHSREDRKS